MRDTIDFQAKLKSIQRIFEIGEYTSAATECVKLSEQALKYVASRYMQRVDEKVRNDVQKAVKKRDRRGAGLEKLTMGHLVQVLQESKFLDAWEQVSGNDLSSFRIIDLDKWTQLRNKIIHESKDATRIDAESLLHNLKLILESFDIVRFEESEGPDLEKSPGRKTSEPPKPSSTQSIHINGNASGNVSFRKGRGLARALTGDFEGAIKDFQAYMEWITKITKKAQVQGGIEALQTTLSMRIFYIIPLQQQYRRWIEALQAGENPFTPEVLEELK